MHHSSLPIQAAALLALRAAIDPNNIQALPLCAELPALNLASSMGLPCPLTDLICFCSNSTFLDQLVPVWSSACKPADVTAAAQFASAQCSDQSLTLPGFAPATATATTNLTAFSTKPGASTSVDPGFTGKNSFTIITTTQDSFTQSTATVASMSTPPSPVIFQSTVSPSIPTSNTQSSPSASSTSGSVGRIVNRTLIPWSAIVMALIL